MIFSHAFIGMILAATIGLHFIPKGTTENKLSRYNAVIWGSAILGAVLPDFDLLYIFFIDHTAHHRALLSHSIIPYAAFLIMFIAVYKYKKLDKIYFVSAIMLFIGVLSHLLTDMIVDPVYFLNPVSNNPFMFRPFLLDKTAGFLGYARSPYMLIEALISFTGMSFLITNLYEYKKVFRFMLAFVGIIELGVVIALLPFLYKFN